MDIKTGYFVGNLIILIPWIFIYLKRKDLRKEMLIGGMLSLPLIFSASLFIPEYWNPPYLFGLIPHTNVGIEDVMFGFFPGSIATVMFEFLSNKRLKKLRKTKNYSHIHLAPYFAIIALFLILDYFFPAYTIHNLMISSAVGAGYILLMRRDLFVQAISSGLLFMILYFLMFTVFNYMLYPEYITKVYNLQNLSGILLFKLPLEEYLFAFCVGIAWSGIYEYIFNYKTVDRR